MADKAKHSHPQAKDTDKVTSNPQDDIPQQTTGDNTVKDPDDWKTGDEPMTGAQRSYLHTLASEAHEEVDDNLTKAEASKRIDELRKKTGRDFDKDQS